jgi:hypothetical protein
MAIETPFDQFTQGGNYIGAGEMLLALLIQL